VERSKTQEAVESFQSARSAVRNAYRSLFVAAEALEDAQAVSRETQEPEVYEGLEACQALLSLVECALGGMLNEITSQGYTSHG